MFYFNLDGRQSVRVCPCRRACAVLLTFPFLATISLRAQEALRSALSTETLINTQNAPTSLPAPEPGEHYVGPINYTLSTSVGIGFDDNANLTQNNPKSDVFLNGGLGVDISWLATDKSQLRFGAQFEYTTYMARTHDDILNISPDSALTWSFQIGDGSVTLYDQFNYAEEVVTVPSVGGVASLPRFDNTIGTRTQWLPGNWDLELGLSHSDYRSTSKIDAYLDSSSEYLFMRGAWRFAENTEAGLELSASETDYRADFQSDNSSYSIGPFATWNVTQFIRANLHGGPTIYQFDAAGPLQPASTLTSYYLKFDLSHQLTQFLSHDLSVERDVNLGLNRGNQYNQQLTIGYNINWKATQNNGVNANLSYVQGSQPLTTQAPAATEHYDQLSFGLGISHQFTEKLSGNIAYTYYKRNSNIPGTIYEANTVSLEIGYHF